MARAMCGFLFPAAAGAAGLAGEDDLLLFFLPCLEEAEASLKLLIELGRASETLLSAFEAGSAEFENGWIGMPAGALAGPEASLGRDDGALPGGSGEEFFGAETDESESERSSSTCGELSIADSRFGGGESETGVAVVGFEGVGAVF